MYFLFEELSIYCVSLRERCIYNEEQLLVDITWFNLVWFSVAISFNCNAHNLCCILNTVLDYYFAMFLTNDSDMPGQHWLQHFLMA